VGKHIKPRIIGLKMNKVTAGKIESILDQMKEYAPAARHRIYSLIRRVYNWSIKRKHNSGESPCSGVELPKYDDQVTRALSMYELERLHNLTLFKTPRR